MAKTFTVQEIHHKEISPGKGSIIWLLTDEKGKARKVNAITDVGTDGVIHKMRSVYKRETPLVDRLYSVTEAEVFTIDFSNYNKQENYAPREVYGNMRNIEKVGSMAAGFSRVLMIAGLLLTLWLANGLFNDIMQMQLKVAGTFKVVESSIR